MNQQYPQDKQHQQELKQQPSNKKAVVTRTEEIMINGFTDKEFNNFKSTMEPFIKETDGKNN